MLYVLSIVNIRGNLFHHHLLYLVLTKLDDQPMFHLFLIYVDADIVKVAAW